MESTAREPKRNQFNRTIQHLAGRELTATGSVRAIHNLAGRELTATGSVRAIPN